MGQTLVRTGPKFVYQTPNIYDPDSWGSHRYTVASALRNSLCTHMETEEMVAGRQTEMVHPKKSFIAGYLLEKLLESKVPPVSFTVFLVSRGGGG
jgi:hypothetical protein